MVIRYYISLDKKLVEATTGKATQASYGEAFLAVVPVYPRILETL
jgi:hypothetical protein